MVTRKDLQGLIGRSILTPYPGYCVTGIILPTYSDAKIFSREISAMLAELPSWLDPKVRTITTREIEYGFGKFVFMYSSNCGRGRSFDNIYMSSRLSEKDKEQHCFVILPILSSGKTFITFDDDH
jgi:hypothetical protein